MALPYNEAILNLLGKIKRANYEGNTAEVLHALKEMNTTNEIKMAYQSAGEYKDLEDLIYSEIGSNTDISLETTSRLQHMIAEKISKIEKGE